MGERWLILSYWANCEARAPSHHIDDRLPHFRAAGVKVEMITSICGPRPEGWGSRWRRVPSLSSSGYRFEVRHVTEGMGRPWGEIARALLTLPVLAFYAIEKWMVNLESTFWWWVSAGIGGLWWTRRRKPDVIYSTGGPMSAHAGAALIAWIRRVPWIAEMQDPLTHPGRGRGVIAKWVMRRLERLVHARATGVVYVTRAACDGGIGRAGRGAECTFVYPGAEVRAGPCLFEQGDCMRIAHVGTLSGTRSPEVLMEAVRRLAERRPEVRREVRLRLVGSLDRQSRGMVRAFPYPEMVEAVDKVPRRRALEVAANADVLLVIQDRDAVSEETIPSKTYEYLIAGRPILGLVFRNAELARMLRGAGHRVVEADDVQGVEGELEGLYERWRKGALRAEPFTRYTPARAVNRLVEWSRQLRARRGRGSRLTRQGDDR